MSGKNSIQVGIKVRPLFGKEKDQQMPWRVVGNSIQLLDSQTEPYCFDHIFDQDATNQIIFDKMAKQIVHSAIKGFNGTIFAYGQTSSGKTYTMMGDDDNPGVMVLAAKEIFKEIERTQDRQFLLRVGFIEIYNEKIYDLLNKKNQDLKIHEVATGIVNVNCEEIIIRSEDDLLNNLDRGGKERTVCETNMNERSSRSHAIFRIIIESRKMDRSEDDAVIQSVINLVDLAGSERADQTGARGTRLKEGGHINKSLLFLSNVIKRLSENEDEKFVSFRDSKLTRILQASLGGNALTAIICTIKPNSVEETQSTLNFALRAKAIKNKPQVNEIISEATMMKRLEQEIKVLKTRLEEEQKKNASKIRVRQLEERIKDEDLKIISCNSLHSIRKRENRRRTWCPSTSVDAGMTSQQVSALPVPATGSQIAPGLLHPSRLKAPKSSCYNTPLITMRQIPECPSSSKAGSGLPIKPEDLTEIDEEFAPAESVNFDILSSPIPTPRNQELHCKVSITPKLTACPKSMLENVEHALSELEKYTNLENKVDVQYEPDLALKQKVEALTQRNTLLENERLQYLQLQNEIEVTTENLTETQKRCEKLQAQLAELTSSNITANEKISKYEAELDELKKTNEKLAMENREAVNLEFEFKRHKNKSKLRENELLEALNEKEKDILRLEKSINSLSSERLQNSKEELLQKSLNGDGGETAEDGKVCIKCEDLHRLLEENKKITSDFEKLTLEYEELKLNYAEIGKENEANKLKILNLEELQVKEKADCEKILLDVQQLREKLHKVQEDYDLLSSENSSKDEECIKLNRQLEVAKEEMMVLEKKFTKLELSWQEQQETIKDIETQYTAIQTKYEQLQNEYDQLEATRSQSLTDYQRIEKENIDLQTEIEDLKNKVHDAQQRLLESNARYEDSVKENKTANEEYFTKTSKVQTQLEELQKEYDDLSNQLMDNIQESEVLKNENAKLKEKLKNYEENIKDVTKAETEISELKSQLEKVLINEDKSLLKTPSSCRNSSTRSSGVGVEDEDRVNSPQSPDLLSKFHKISESLTEIEVEHIKGQSKVFKSVSKNSTPNSYKMYLKNIFGVRKTRKEFDMEIENIYMQGSFKQHSFHIVKLSDDNKTYEVEYTDTDTNNCTNAAEYIEKLKKEISDLRAINEQERENNKSLLESTERAFSEMREQITQLTSELLEKSMFVENCACKTYQKQIEDLEKEKADITLMCEELQEKINCTSNGSLNMLFNSTTQGSEIKSITDDQLKELEQLKLREQQLLESYDSQTKTLEEMVQRCIDMETDLEAAREQLKTQEEQFKEKHNLLQLEILEKLELSASEHRENMKKYNKEWQERKDEYEQTIQDLQKQIDVLKQTTTKADNLNIDIKQESNFVSPEIYVKEEKIDHMDMSYADDVAAIKQDKCKLEEENLNLKQRLSAAEELLEHTKEEITLLDAKIVSLEELLLDNKRLHITLTKENSSLKTQIDDIKNDLNRIPDLHEKNQQLSDEVEKLNREYSELQNKLQKSESQIQEYRKEDISRKEQIKVLQTKLTNLISLDEEKKSLANDFENLKQNYAQVRNKLHIAEVQIEEFCNEDAKREELIGTLQTKLCNMTAVEKENHNLELENEHLKETLNILKEKESESLKEIEQLKVRVETLMENVSELVNSSAKLQREKTDLEEKLQKITDEHNWLQTDKASLDVELSELTKEKTTLAEQIRRLKEKEKTEELLEKIIEDKTKLEQDLYTLTEKLESAQHQLEENEKYISLAREERDQIQDDLQSLRKALTKIIEEKHLQLEEEDRENERSKRNSFNLYRDLQVIKLGFTKAIAEKQDREHKMREYQRNNSQLKEEIEKLDLERREQQLSLEKAEHENNNLQQDLKAISTALEEKRQEFNNLETNYHTAQQQKEALQQQLNDLTADLIKFKEEPRKSIGNTRVQSDLQTTKESLGKLQEEHQKMQEKLKHYEKLQQDKNNLEATLNVLKMSHMEALSSLQVEKNKLHKTVQEYEQQNEEFKEKEKTLQQKIESLSEQLNKMRSKVDSYEKLLHKHKEMENVLASRTIENQKLQQEIVQFNSQHDNYLSKIENLSSEIEKLNTQLDKQADEKAMLETEFSQLKATLQIEQSSLQKEHLELKSYLKELKLKYDSLQQTNCQLENLNQQLQQQLNSVKERLNELNRLREELKAFIVQQRSLKAKVDEAKGCSLALGAEVERHEHLLQKHCELYNSQIAELETKQHSLSKENFTLSVNIETLQKDKLSLELKLREITLRNFEQDLQRQTLDVVENTSLDSNGSYSSKGRRSLERLGADSLEEKLLHQKNFTTAERKNRRLSTHDERRRQSYWGVSHDKETMTDPVDTSCKCIELDLKLKECERNLFIKSSQVTALNMELKNHPLKDENAILKKRLQEEQDKHHIDIKRYKNKLQEQSSKLEKALAVAAHATAKSSHAATAAALASEQLPPISPKVLEDGSTQTDDDLSKSLQRLRGKYNDLKNICRHRYNLIKELEGKVAQKENSDFNSLSALEAAQAKVLNKQCESLRKELKDVREKYENAKLVLHSRREEITKLREQLAKSQ